MWWLKRYFLPFMYWRMMLKGLRLDIPHKPRGFDESEVARTA